MVNGFVTETVSVSFRHFGCLLLPIVQDPVLRATSHPPLHLLIITRSRWAWTGNLKEYLILTWNRFKIWIYFTIFVMKEQMVLISHTGLSITERINSCFPLMRWSLFDSAVRIMLSNLAGTAYSTERWVAVFNCVGSAGVIDVPAIPREYYVISISAPILAVTRGVIALRLF